MDTEDLLEDLTTRRFRFVWDRLAGYDVRSAKALYTEVAGLPLAIRQHGLAPTIALLAGRGGRAKYALDVLAEWLLERSPTQLLRAAGSADGRSARNANGRSARDADVRPARDVDGRALLRALMGVGDPLTLSAVTEDAIELAAALKAVAGALKA